jgi:IclR family pca regulon transcriptional regulator
MIGFVYKRALVTHSNIKYCNAIQMTASISRFFISSLARGLTILNSFTREKPFLTLSEISKLTGLSKAAVQRYTFTLQELAYLERDENKVFRLGPKVFSLGFGVLRSLEIRKLAYPYMKKTSQETGQTVNLEILDETNVIFIERIEVKRIIGYEVQVGSRLPAYCTSAGKAILAFLPPEKRDEIVPCLQFERLTEHTIMDEGRLLEDLKETKRRGFSINDQEVSLSSRAIGAPVFSSEANVVAAVSIVVNASLFSRDELEKRFSPVVMALAKKISAMLGWMDDIPKE